jgi:hypothetical protein
MEERAGAPFTSKVLGGTRTECDLVAKVAQSGVITAISQANKLAYKQNVSRAACRAWN